MDNMPIPTRPQALTAEERVTRLEEQIAAIKADINEVLPAVRAEAKRRGWTGLGEAS